MTGATRRPVHPALTHAPMGGLLIAVVFDLFSAVDGGAHPWGRELYRAATFTLMVSVAIMVLAIGSGLVDRARATAEGTPVRSRVNLHGMVMAAVAVGAVVDITLRRQVYPAARHTPAGAFVVTLVVFAAAVVGGEFGGRLTYRAGLNVARPLPSTPRPSAQVSSGGPDEPSA